MIKPICIICKEELAEFGGILLSPPDKDDRVVKSHICKKCYDDLLFDSEEQWQKGLK